MSETQNMLTMEKKSTQKKEKNNTRDVHTHTSCIVMHQVKTMASAAGKAEPFSLFEAIMKQFTEHFSHSYVEEAVKVNVCLQLSKERVHMCVNLCFYNQDQY